MTHSIVVTDTNFTQWAGAMQYCVMASKGAAGHIYYTGGDVASPGSYTTSAHAGYHAVATYRDNRYTKI